MPRRRTHRTGAADGQPEESAREKDAVPDGENRQVPGAHGLPLHQSPARTIHQSFASTIASQDDYYDGYYDDDFEEEDFDGFVEEDLGEIDDGTLKLAKQQAEARSSAHADAHQQRLLALAREHFDSGAAPQTPTSGATPLSQPLPAAGQPPRPGLGAVRHAALQERCRQALGDLFPAVHQYLSEARRGMAEERDVRKNLQAIVGRDRLNDCMCVDELVFVEMTAG